MKDTSGTAVSPHTAEARPQSKHPASRRLSQTCMSESMSVYDTNEYIKSCINIESSGVFDRHVAVEAKCIQIKSQ